MDPRVEEFVQFQLRIANGPFYYWTGPGRCDPLRSGYADCSGNEVAALRHVGVSIECTGSFALAIMGHQAGAGISIAEARRTRGALVYVGIHEGQGGIPGEDEGHVATSLGDGRIVHAANRRAGIIISDFERHAWDWAGLPHWIIALPAPDPIPGPYPTRVLPRMEPTMIVMHRNGGPENEEPILFVDPDPTKRQVVSHNLARITWDGGNPSTNHETANPHVTTIGIPGPADERVLALEPVAGTWAPDRTSVRIKAVTSGAAQRHGLAHL